MHLHDTVACCEFHLLAREFRILRKEVTQHQRFCSSTCGPPAVPPHEARPHAVQLPSYRVVPKVLSHHMQHRRDHKLVLQCRGVLEHYACLCELCQRAGRHGFAGDGSKGYPGQHILLALIAVDIAVDIVIPMARVHHPTEGDHDAVEGVGSVRQRTVRWLHCKTARRLNVLPPSAPPLVYAAPNSPGGVEQLMGIAFA